MAESPLEPNLESTDMEEKMKVDTMNGTMQECCSTTVKPDTLHSTNAPGHKRQQDTVDCLCETDPKRIKHENINLHRNLEKSLVEEGRGVSVNNTASSGAIVNNPNISGCNISTLTFNFNGATQQSCPGQQEGGGCDVAEMRTQLKKQLRSRFSTIHQKSYSISKVQDMYTKLYTVKGCTGGVYYAHEISALNMRQIGTGKRPEGKEVELGDMFTDKSVTKVLTLGIAGVGKTVAVQKFVMDWAENGDGAEGKAHQDIDFVFVLLFRELNTLKKECHSISDLLLKIYPDLKDLKNFLEFHKYKILFVLDGLDESRLKLDFNNFDEEEASVDMLITRLISGKLLSTALIWVTTRPAAVSLIPVEWVTWDLVTEVQGFNDPQKIEFFGKFFKTSGCEDYQERANRVIDHVKNNRSLHIMCHIPVFCSIIACVLDKILDDQSQPPKTMTEMYIWYNVFQINRMNEKYNEKKMSQEEQGLFLLKLGKLAFKHLEEGTLIFYEKDLRECGINANCGALQAGLCTQIFNVESTFTGNEVYSFVHLSLQEFLAALYVLHESAARWISPLVKTWKQTASWVFKHSRFDLYKLAVEKALQSQNGHLDLFLRFLLGLAPMYEPKIQPHLKLLPQLAVKEVSIGKTVQYIKEKIKEDLLPERIVNLFHCLNELGDNSLVEEINRYRNSADEEKNLTPAQCSALAYLLLMSAEDFEEFDLKKYLRSDDGLHRMLPVVKVSRRVGLNQCHLSKASCEMMASVLQGTPSHLRELDMSYNDLRDEGVELLCVGLRHSQCRLETLRLNWCHLSKASCEMMASVLQGTPCDTKGHHLRELDMSDNDLQDEGVELLYVGLRHSQCRLETLRLSGCLITPKACSFLASALKSNPSYLKELDLSYNYPGESGVRELTDRLNDHNCKLEAFRCL